MNNCVILYGQVRTLEKTINSIKRLFNEILKYDIYVIINLNVNDDENYFKKLIIDCLNPILLEFVYENKMIYDNLINLQKTTAKNFKTSTISFDQYNKLPYKETYYDIDNIKKFDVEIKDQINNINKINIFPYNMYVEDKLIYNMFIKISSNKYDRVFLIRTDCAWFENLKSKNENIYIKDIGFREKTALKESYNEKIMDINFNEIKYKIMNSKHNVLGNYFHKESLNLKIPNAHARLFCYNDLKKMFDVFNNVEEILKIFEKYPIIYPGWDGELYQKRIYEYLNLKFENDFNLCNYCSLIREK